MGTISGQERLLEYGAQKMARFIACPRDVRLLDGWCDLPATVFDTAPFTGGDPVGQFFPPHLGYGKPRIATHRGFLPFFTFAPWSLMIPGDSSLLEP